MEEYSYTINYDKQSDIWNWYQACNSIGHGVDWSHRVDKDVAVKLQTLNYNDAVEYLDNYLDDLIARESEKIDYGRRFIEKRFIDDFQNACGKLEEITGKPLYRNNFTIQLTTFPRAPYNYEKGEFLLPIEWTNPIANFMHETLHFQTIHYWRDNPQSLLSALVNDKFEDLKEALTVVLDESCVPPMEKADKGYEIHKELRDKLYSEWNKGLSFGELIEFGVRYCSY